MSGVRSMPTFKPSMCLGGGLACEHDWSRIWLRSEDRPPERPRSGPTEVVPRILLQQYKRRMQTGLLEDVRRQRLWDQSGDLNNGGFLAHRNPKESEDEPEILRPTRPCAS